MLPIEVDISPDIVLWVLNQVNKERINNLCIERLTEWKDGKKKPTFTQIESISKATRIPLGYFFLKEPPIENLDILKYRTIDSLNLNNPSRNLIDIIRDMESVQDWMRDYLIKNEYEPLGLVGSQNNFNDVRKIASSMRKYLDINVDWYKKSKDSWDSFKKLRDKLEKCSILVMMNGIVGQNTHRKLDIEEFRAFTLIDKYAPLIFINSNDSPNGKLFSLLHEATHIWIGVSNFYNDRFSIAGDESNIERICNAVTAELLVPNDQFTKKWLNSTDENIEAKINLLSKTFKCGTTVIARRALDNNLIDYQLYKKIAEKAVTYYNLYTINKGQGGDYYITAATRMSKRFILALDNSLNEGKTLFTEAYRLTNTNRRTFSNLVDQVRGISL